MAANAPPQFAKKNIRGSHRVRIAFRGQSHRSAVQRRGIATWSCSEKLLKFVEMIDELFVKNVREREPFYAAIREYLPPKGCTTERVISISRTSKFSVPPFEQYASYTIMFSNSVLEVSFGVERATGNIEYPAVLWSRTSL
jgi:hypothetical protein